MSLRLSIILLCAAGLCSWSAQAQLCTTDALLPPPPVLEIPDVGEMLLTADSMEAQGDALSTLNGNVWLVRTQDKIRADQALYSQQQQQVDLHGNVQYWSDMFEFSSDSMRLFTDNDRRELSDAEYFVLMRRGFGSAEHILQDDTNITYLTKATYTTCDPDDLDWEFRAKHIKLDHDAGQGFAKHMTMRFKKVPFFYFPALSFPIDDRRKSGFLYPSFGDSNRNGFELEVPYYWNIAPQADATLTPHNFSRRGLMLETEWRYLNRWSMNQFDINHLDDDKFGDRRSLFSIDHRGQYGAHWQTLLQAQHVSDEEYFEDFGNSQEDTSQTYLPREFTLTGNWQHWELTQRLKTFQSLDASLPESSEPYRLLPEITLDGVYFALGAGLDFSVNASYTDFQQDARLDGQRFDLLPRLSRQFGDAGWFVIPALSLRHTQYQLDNLELGSIDPEIAQQSPSRTLPIFSLDNGLIFERTFGDDDRYMQTLEPRIFYLHAPLRNQDAIPVFDSALPEFKVAELFTENRFVGADRVGDADQTSVALTTRIQRKATGKELLAATVGQIFYNQDREVTLPGQEPETTERSGIVGDLKLALADRWTSSLDIEWNPDTEKLDRGLLSLRYSRSSRHLLNFSYRFRRAASPTVDDFEQADLAFSMPLSLNWSMVGRWNYSIPERLSLDRFFGIEYESCCFAVRLIARKLLVTNDDEVQNDPDMLDPDFKDSVFIEFSFKGIGQFGSNAKSLLEGNIPGYINPY